MPGLLFRKSRSWRARRGHRDEGRLIVVKIGVEYSRLPAFLVRGPFGLFRWRRSVTATLAVALAEPPGPEAVIV